MPTSPGGFSARRSPRPPPCMGLTPTFPRNGDATALERALRAGASPDARTRIGDTALMIALKKNDVAMARKMLEAGTDVNNAAANGVTALMAAAHAGQGEMVGALLARGADVTAVDRLGKNAMTYAAG